MSAHFSGWLPASGLDRDDWVAAHNNIERSLAAYYDSWSPTAFEGGEDIPWLLVGHDDDGFFVVLNGSLITDAIEHPCSCPHCNNEVCLAKLCKGYIYDLACNIAGARSAGKKISNRQAQMYLWKHTADHLHGDADHWNTQLPVCIMKLIKRHFPDASE